MPARTTVHDVYRLLGHTGDASHRRSLHAPLRRRGSVGVQNVTLDSVVLSGLVHRAHKLHASTVNAMRIPLEKLVDP